MYFVFFKKASQFYEGYTFIRNTGMDWEEKNKEKNKEKTNRRYVDLSVYRLGSVSVKNQTIYSCHFSN